MGFGKVSWLRINLSSKSRNKNMKINLIHIRILLMKDSKIADIDYKGLF